MKYVSDKYKGDPYGMIVVPEGASFDDMVALKQELEERYAEPMPAIEASVERLNNKVAEHLKAMGLTI